MSNLLTSAQILRATGAANDDFDTYSRNIVVYKEPIKTAVANTNNYFGYPDDNNIDYTYTYVSGVFPAKIMYNRQTVKEVNSVPVTFSNGDVIIKVRPDCKDYINNGKTENIVVDGNTFNVLTDDGVKNYLGLVFHQYTLERTK